MATPIHSSASFHQTETGRASYSNIGCLGEDTTDNEYLDSTLVHLVSMLAYQLRDRKMLAGGVGLKLRYSDFRTYTRSQAIEPTSRDADLLRTVRGMFAKIYSRRVRVRLLGVRVERFCPDGEQFEIFGYKARNRELLLSECIDEVRNRFGNYSIRPGHALVRLKTGTVPIFRKMSPGLSLQVYIALPFEVV